MSIDWKKVGAFFSDNKHHFIAVVLVVLFGLMMFAGTVEGEDNSTARQAVIDAAKWVTKNRLVAGFLGLTVSLVAVYIPRDWFSKNIIQGWSWRVAGCYAVGLLLGSAAMMTTLWLGDELQWTRFVAVAYFLGIAVLTALAAHWRAGWEAPSFAYLGWAAVLMALVPAWVAITQLAGKI
jgi:hypothetical protein